MIEDSLTITITGKTEHIDVPGFLAVIDNTIDLLREIDCAAGQQRNAQIEWRIRAVSMHSPLVFTIFADVPTRPQFGRYVLEICTKGLREMESGLRATPRYFTTSALEYARKIVAPLNTSLDRIALTLEGETPNVLSQRVAASADMLLPKEHDEIGSFEGRLETLTVHGRRQFVIWEFVSDVRIECNFPPDMLGQAQACFDRRVRVGGVVRYARNGMPRSIAVEEVTPLRDQKDLPQARDLENRTGKPQWTVNAIG